MEIEVTFLTRRGNAVMRRSRRIEARRIRLGRGTDNEVQLPDIRVDLTAAALFPRSGILTILAQGPSSLRVNGRSTRSASIAPGDEILIGPYRIGLSEPPTGCDASLAIELVQPLDDSLDRLISQAQPKLDTAIFGKRGASWAGFLVIALLFLVTPLIIHSLGSPATLGITPSEPGALGALAISWQPGELSNSHKFFAANCATCHLKAFARVPDDACVGCHGRVGGHMDASAAFASPSHAAETTQCTGCHKEHRGAHGIIITEGRLCIGCHNSAPVAAVGGPRHPMSFPDHPEFRVRVVADPAQPRFERVALGGTEPPTNRPGLKFSHAAHLVASGFPGLGYKPMACADCHVAAPSGFLPISYKQQCERCHSLEFERQDLPWPNGKVPHGDDLGIAAAVWNFYAGKSLQGGIADPTPAVARRFPGAAASAAVGAPERGTQIWVAEKTDAALRTVIFDKNRGCAYCHFGAGPEGAFDISSILASAAAPDKQAPSSIVAPVILHNQFLPLARFNHAKHTTLECEHCHAARRAETSSAVLIPGIDNCRGCHGSEKAGLRVESTCITCHRFHNAEPKPWRADAMPSP